MTGTGPIPQDVTVRADLPGGGVLVRTLPAPGPAPWLWLLHGRGGGVDELAPAFEAVALAVASGLLPPLTLAAPDAPWQDRSCWFVDGTGPGALPVESVLLEHVRPAVEAALGPPPDRAARLVGGISMGGAAALRWSLVRRDLFAGALLLSPAVYDGAPPAGSSVRRDGVCSAPAGGFSSRRWRQQLHVASLLAAVPPSAHGLAVATVVGDGEPANGDPQMCDLDLEAARLHARLKRAPGVTPTLRVVAGGHDWTVWRSALVSGLQDLLTRPPGDPVSGPVRRATARRPGPNVAGRSVPGRGGT